MKTKLLALKDKLWAKNWLRDLLSSGIFFCMMVGLDGVLRFIYQEAGMTPPDSDIPWTFTLAWAFLITSLVRLFPARGQKAAMGIFGALFQVLYLTNALLFRARGTFFSFSALIFAADGFRFLDPSYLRVRKLVWVGLLCGVLSTALAVWLVPPVKRSLKGRGAALLAIVLSVAAINLNREKNLTDRLAIHFDMYQASLLYDDFSNPNECLPLAGMYQYTFRDFCITYGIYDKLGRASHGEVVQKLDRWYAGKTPDPDNEWTGRFRGKNVFLIQLEAIDTWMLCEEFMPNLYRIQQESLDFTQSFTPLYLDAGTFNTEMIVNTGLVSPFTGSTSSMYSRNEYPDTLARLLTAEGYTANSFHRSSGAVYNRAEVHENWGYAHYYSGTEMEIPSEEMDFDSALMEAYDIMTAQPPFLNLVITYSGHGPYQDSPVSARYFDYAAQRLPAGADEMLIHAFAHAYETDRFIGKFYDRLEADGLLEDTVLVFYSDHYNYYTMSDGLVMAQKGVDDKNMMTRTPFFIYEKNTLPMKIDKAISQMDILPTLVNLLGLDNDGTHYVGNDIFSPNGGYAVFADYSWYDGQTYWNALGDEAPTEEIKARNEELRERLEMSWDTMRVNYFGK
ncbi:MAG: sulfatase-like hydrolase/transferase [Lawsonibacter sp.]|nr:sulfatase-like hydrolase/transferase [Lawsonibacter sp.]